MINKLIPHNYRLPILFAFVLCLGVSLEAQEYKEMMTQFEKYTFEDIQQSAEAYFEERGTGKGSGYKHWKRWEFNAQRMIDDEGYLKPDRYYFHELAEFNRVRNLKNEGRSEQCASDWKALGPVELNITSGYNPGIGRITSFAVDPQDSSHIIIGSQTGGVWQSQDDGATWIPLTDEYVNMVVYSLAIDPTDSDVYYWGGNGGSLFKSEDRGMSWTEYGTGGFGNVNKIMVRHNNPLEVWTSVEYAGIFRSPNGGRNSFRVVDDITYDIEFHPTDTSIVYASGHNLWKSVNGGLNFDQMTFDSSNFQAKMMDVSAAAPDNLYVLQCEGGGYEGLYISRDQGASYEKKDHGNKNFMGYSFTADDVFGQAPRDMDIVVSDWDSNEVFIAGINLWRSFNGGDSFDIITHWIYPFDDFAEYSYCHADIDILEWRNGKVLIGSDGGFYSFEDSRDTLIGKNTILEKGKGINVHQFYRIGVAQTDPPIVSGGAQDNGSSVWIDDGWNSWFGADGMESFVLSDSANTIFGTYQFGGLLYSTDGGQSAQYVFGLGDLQGTGRWVTPFEKDPTDSTTIYVGFDRIYKSSDYGFTFDTISQPFGPQHFKVAPSGSDTIYSASGRILFRTHDGGATDWELIYDGVEFGEPSINYIAIHPRNANLIAMAISGSNKVIVSRNGGQDWEVWNENLPNFEALCVTWHDNDYESLYLGMNYGIYYRDSLTKEWEVFSNGLPNVIINELEINDLTQEIYAGTYGRGLWVSPVCDPITNNTEIEEDLKFALVPNPVSLNSNIELSLGSDWRGKTSVKIYDRSGYLVYAKEMERDNKKLSIPTKNWKRGIYYIRAYSLGQTFTQLISVQ